MFIGVALLLSLPLGGYVLWHSANIALSGIAHRRARSPAGADQVPPPGKVALLYLACDDFDPHACSTLLWQEGVDFDIFILDDSTRSAEHRRIEEWCRAQAKPITIVRRAHRTGFKSGNINHWLTHVGDAHVYPYMLVIDADEHIPSDFARALLHHLIASDRAFVQACHLGTATLTTRFQRSLHPQVMSEWLYQVPARNVVGIPPMLGHGALLRTESVQRAGGFPDLVSEDLALTLRLAEIGQRGIVAVDVVGYEGFPPTYVAYWKRRQRWIRADAELVRKMLATWWRSAVGWGGKIDLSLRELRLPVASLYWLLLMYMAATSALGGWRESAEVLPASVWACFPLAVVPALPVLTSGRIGFRQRMRYLCVMPFVGAATIPLHPVATVQGVAGIRGFEPTGSPDGRKETRWWSIWEALTACMLCIGGAQSANLLLIAIGFACGCSPLLRSHREDLVLVIGSYVFWVLLVYQAGIDVMCGVVPVAHPLALVGLALTLV